MDYLLVKIRLLLTLIVNRKITIKKIFNYGHNLLRRLLKTKKAGFLPSLIDFETTNRCNLSCLTCRDNKLDPSGKFVYLENFVTLKKNKIRLGEMSLKLFKRVIDETHKHILLAVLYIQGEPLLNKDIFKMVKYATEKQVATLLSTNGVLLTEKNSRLLLENGLDFLKIAISGFTQAIYSINHRNGDIQKVKKNIRSLMKVKKQLNSHTLIMLDYILFEHNQHQLALARNFAKSLGIVFNVRDGRASSHPKNQMIKGKKRMPVEKICDWLWVLAVVHWDGRIFPCCEFGMYNNLKHQGFYNDNLVQIWNGKKYQNLRKFFINKEEKKKPYVCQICHYKGSAFQA